MTPDPRAGLSITVLLKFAGQAYPRRNDRQVVHKALTDPLFPRTFFIRNILTLEQESSWKRCPHRLQRAMLLRMLLQRSVFFLQVKRWLQTHEIGLPATAGDLSAADSAPREGGYCSHCGQCCEIASGLAQFPAPEQLPQRWREVFGTGLGPHHRFCAFLWEAAGTGRSLCAIHRWRPLPCRLFEREECDYLEQHPGPPAQHEDIPLPHRLVRCAGIPDR